MRVLALYLLALAAANAATEESRLQLCTGIDDDADRLACYDGVAGRHRDAGVYTTAPPVAPEKPAATPGRVIQTEQAPPPQKPPPARAESRPDESEFGLEHVEEKNTGAISSRYDGEFTGWSGRTLFKLENGQVWRQAESGRFRTKMERPMITIERGAFSSYRMKVEGLNRSVRVKRVR